MDITTESIHSESSSIFLRNQRLPYCRANGLAENRRKQDHPSWTSKVYFENKYKNMHNEVMWSEPILISWDNKANASAVTWKCEKGELQRSSVVHSVTDVLIRSRRFGPVLHWVSLNGLSLNFNDLIRSLCAFKLISFDENELNNKGERGMWVKTPTNTKQQAGGQSYLLCFIWKAQ